MRVFVKSKKSLMMIDACRGDAMLDGVRLSSNNQKTGFYTDSTLLSTLRGHDDDPESIHRRLRRTHRT
jgi:hypothetical protein